MDCLCNLFKIRIEGDRMVSVPIDSHIKFGGLSSEYSVQFHPIVICMSRLSNTRKVVADTIIERLKIPTRRDFSKECTHLISDEVTATMKFLHAVMLKTPIATSVWLEELQRTLTSPPTTFPPSVSDYFPKSSSENNFNFALDRSTLFSGIIVTTDSPPSLDTLNVRH